MYNESRTAAFFFVLFVTTSTFYLHSLVLSVVFQTYIQASTEIHERSILDREEAIELAFDSLQSVSDIEFDEEEEYGRLVGLAILEKVLRKMRPHYNAMKIHALLEILDPTGQRIIDFPTFRTKIRQALNTSIRSTPSKTPFAFLIELVAALVAVSNFIYVILLTSEFEADWFDFITFPAGFLITLLGVLELLVRFNPFRILDYAPTTRLNSTFDGLAAVAATISCYGIYRHFTAGRYTIELLLTGRAIDLIRVMRFFQIFRDVVHRSAVVFPALAGPVALVVSTHHLFVYSGMAIWGGAIQVGEHEGEITPLYDLNNFNSYWEGLVTMFQILVINDWHAIAEVYLYSTSWSSPYIVYPFFVGANLIAVCIMLNCLTAFFVGAFVTKLEGASKEDQEEVFTTVQKQREFQIDTSMRSMKRVSSSRKLLVDDSTRSIEEEDVVEFDVFEREGFDKIMRTVAGEDDDDGDEVAKELCKTLELFENLSPER